MWVGLVLIKVKAGSIFCCRLIIGDRCPPVTTRIVRIPTTCSSFSAPCSRRGPKARTTGNLSPWRDDPCLPLGFVGKGSAADEISQRFERGGQHDVSDRLQLLGETQGVRRLRAGRRNCTRNAR